MQKKVYHPIGIVVTDIKAEAPKLKLMDRRVNRLVEMQKEQQFLYD